MRTDGWERIIEKDIEDLQSENRAQQSEINSLKEWRSFILGAAAIIGVLVGAFANQFWTAIKSIL